MNHHFKVPTIQNNQWVITEEEQQHDQQYNAKTILTLGSCTDELIEKRQKFLVVEEMKQSNNVVQKYPITEKQMKR